MSTYQVRTFAAEAARSVGRRLRARRRRAGGPARVRGHVRPGGEPRAGRAETAEQRPQPRTIPLPQAASPRDAGRPAIRGAGKPEPVGADAQLADPAGEAASLAESRAGQAELDSLRGALVHELDRLAAGDDCSASFRRAG